MKNIREKWEIYFQNPFNFSLISLMILHYFSWESLGILLKILHCFISYESTKNPYEFCRESPENLGRTNVEISPQFPRGFSFHSQPKFLRGSPSTKDSLQNPRDFARWELSKSRWSHNFAQHCVNTYIDTWIWRRLRTHPDFYWCYDAEKHELRS